MSAARSKLLHLSPQVRGQGGVESLLARHATLDAREGFDASQMALFDPAPAVGREAYSTQSFSWRSTPREMRRSMQRSLSAHRGSIIIWHNAWGVPWFAAVDGSCRRIVYLHSGEIFFRDWLPAVRDWFDAVICDNSFAEQTCVRLLPGFPRERIISLRQPVSAPTNRPALTRPPHQEWVLGCAGRLVREQKRWERLVPFVAELKRRRFPFRLEVVGDGRFRRWLENSFVDDSAIRFFGWLEGEAYWRHLGGWDAAIFFSDHEGGPYVMIEAMTAGVLPIYPTIGGSLGDDYAPRVDPRCYYPAGDPVAAARAVCEVLASPVEVLEELRQRAHALAAPHQDGPYSAAFSEFVSRIAAWPRISREPAAESGRKTYAADLLPLGLITRFLPAALWR